jgi:hypothetical protein
LGERELIKSLSLPVLVALLLTNMLALTFDIKASSNVFSVPPREHDNSLVLTYYFPSPVITEGPFYDSVVVPGLPQDGAEDEPVLPFKMAKALIPQGKDLQRIDVTAENRIVLKGSYNVEYGKTPIPISSNGSVEGLPDEKIYGSATPFPGVLFSQMSEQHLRGYRILMLKLHPIQYVPRKGKLFYFETMTVTLSLRETGNISPLFRNLPKDKALVLGVVDNPEEVNKHMRTVARKYSASLVYPSFSYDYVIITTTDLIPSFEPLIDWKIQKGLNATIVPLEDIISDRDYYCDGLFGDGCGTSKFNDTAAHIRNFIKDAYQNWGTEYVLLGGDADLIPVRGVCACVGDVIDYDIPCDMYYGTLDGSWDNDNDTRFGESAVEDENMPQCHGAAGEEADFFAEVYIGRAPVETSDEVSIFVNKTLWYEQASDDSYFKKALMVGETLDRYTEGGNSKDLVTDVIPQYTTKRLYDRDRSLSHSSVINELNSGIHIVNHCGHANQGTVMELYKSDVNQLSNDEYFMVYSIGCYSAAFDLGTGETDSIAEHFILSSNGSFAYIGNTRYGWYIPGTTRGPGDRFDREFFHVLSKGERILGKALQLSKENLLGRFFHRWTCFTLILLGDPEIQIATEIKSPTAHFKPVTDLLYPVVLQGCVQLRGTAKRGTAADATFEKFTVEFGLGRNPTSWTTLGINLTSLGNEEVEDGVLGTWNTSLVTPFMEYTLKLTVFDEDGRIGEDRWIVGVEPVPTIQVNSYPTEIRVGQTLTVEVYVVNVRKLYELDVEFWWNATLLDCVSHTVTVPIENYPNGVLHEPIEIILEEINQTAGTYLLAVESMYPASPFDGSGAIFKMDFEVREVGTCTLIFSSSNLFDKSARPIDHKVDGEVVEILPGIHDVAVTEISIDKTDVCEGLSVNLNVTIENQGSFTESFNVTAYANEISINTTEVSLTHYSLMMITFTWNITDVVLGGYTISATANVVSGENDIADNTYVGDIVTVREPIFDVAVLGTNLSRTVVGQGYIVSINVTAENQGDLTSTFNVTVYADLNTIIMGDEIIIEVENVTLKGGELNTIIFTWDTTGSAKGNYTVGAYASPVSSETDVGDNAFIDDWVVVTMPGDVDGDFDVDIYEIVSICAAYGSEIGDPRYNAHCDIDGDGDIDIYDVVIACSNYG